jgi:pre-mRNA-processing factor 19
VAESPVVSPVSGQIYEKRLIEKYIAENGCDPVGQEPLSVDQLVAVKVSPLVKPKPPSATSIPAILKSLQDEWDAVMLHSFTLRQQLQTARQELSHALYQHDAACRVIARMTKEVTAAREALATLKPQAGIPAAAAAAATVPSEAAAGGGAAVATAQEATGMTDEILEKLQEKAKVLTGERKKRGKTVAGLTSADAIADFKPLASHPGLHSASTPGILAVDINANNTDLILTGGADKNATVFNKENEQVISILKGHTKKVNRVIYHPASEDTVLTASHDATIRLWNVPTSQTLKLLRIHDHAVTGLSLHATGDYVLSTSVDQHWAFSDIRAGRLISKVTDESELTCAQFHPDGLIFGTGTADSIIKIWDLKEVNFTFKLVLA